MRRRDFIAGMSGVAMAWPVAARAQRLTAPMIAFLSSHSPEESAEQTSAFRRGLAAFGYVEGQSVAIEYRWARGDYTRLPTYANELAALHPAAIVAAGGTPSARAARAASRTIPILFVTSEPVRDGLVRTLNRPGGNVSGVDLMTGELGGKRLELLIQLVPAAQIVGFLSNPQNQYADAYIRDLQSAARSLNRRLIVVGAGTVADLKASIAAVRRAGATALVVQNDASFDARRDLIVELISEQLLPAIYHIREYPAGGGLMSYGPNLAEAYHQAGLQTGRVLKGTNVADLPVVRPTRFELAINANAAKALGLSIPLSLLAEADEVID